MKAEARQDGWGAWTVNYGFYGRAESRELVWVVEHIENGSEADAKELVGLSPAITAVVEANLGAKPNAIEEAIVQYPLTELQARAIRQLAGPQNRVRLRAKRVAGGWELSEYDFNKWTAQVPDRSEQ